MGNYIFYNIDYVQFFKIIVIEEIFEKSLTVICLNHPPDNDK